MRPLVDRLLEADDLPAALLRLALALQAGILSAPVLKMRALVAAESADPRTAAQQFTWLSIAEPLNEWTLVGER